MNLIEENFKDCQLTIKCAVSIVKHRTSRTMAKELNVYSDNVYHLLSWTSDVIGFSMTIHFVTGDLIMATKLFKIINRQIIASNVNHMWFMGQETHKTKTEIGNSPFVL